jgi:hypothetical protein
MMADDGVDQTLELLARLEPLSPDPRRSVQVQARCRAQLARSRKRQATIDRMSEAGQRLLASAAIGFCLIYLAALVATTVRVHLLLK